MNDAAPSTGSPSFGGLVLVVCLNEADHLRRCLDALSGCHRVVVADMGSTDASEQVARAAGAEVWIVERAPVVEMVLAGLMPQLRSEDWVLRLDPDEIIPADLLAEIDRRTQSAPSFVANMPLPFQYYFGDRPLRGTVWGGIKVIPDRVFRPSAVRPDRHVHGRDATVEGYEVGQCVSGPPIQHMWARSYRHLFAKHRRYLAHEGEAMRAQGQRWSWRAYLRAMGGALYASLIRTGAWRDGRTGLALTVVYLHYASTRWMSLRRSEAGQAKS